MCRVDICFIANFFSCFYFVHVSIVYSFANGGVLSIGFDSSVEKVSHDSIANHGYLSIAI